MLHKFLVALVVDSNTNANRKNPNPSTTTSKECCRKENAQRKKNIRKYLLGNSGPSIEKSTGTRNQGAPPMSLEISASFFLVRWGICS